jgi:hypothetical protein
MLALMRLRRSLLITVPLTKVQTMALPTFDDLPFNDRPDLTPYLLHLTKNTNKADEYSAYDNLVSILKKGEVCGSSHGMIKGGHKAACFMDVPFASLKYVLTPENSGPKAPRYEPYGIAVTKQHAYKKGCRPVLYLSNYEVTRLRIPKPDLWRVVRFEVSEGGRWISWLHEREWRCKGDFKLPPSLHAAFVRNTDEAKQLTRELADEPTQFKCVPKSVIPFTVICQGLFV